MALTSILDRSHHKPKSVVVLNNLSQFTSLRSHQGFSAEANKCDIMKLHGFPICQCPSANDVRVPYCKCDDPPEVSPFLRIRWKRLVIDEGHVASTISTNLNTFAQLLSVERRWIVTGTPTTNLLGLSFGKSSEDDSEPIASTAPSSLSGSVNGEDETQTVPRSWTSHDREDLRKLATMMTHFLKVPRFAANPKILKDQVIDTLLHSDGPLPGAIQVLMQVMGMEMIRHRYVPVNHLAFNT